MKNLAQQWLLNSGYTLESVWEKPADDFAYWHGRPEEHGCWYGCCKILARELAAHLSNSESVVKIAWIFDVDDELIIDKDDYEWSYHVVTIVNGVVHCAWFPDKMITVEEYCKLFDTDVAVYITDSDGKEPQHTVDSPSFIVKQLN